MDKCLTQIDCNHRCHLNTINFWWTNSQLILIRIATWTYKVSGRKVCRLDDCHPSMLSDVMVLNDIIEQAAIDRTQAKATTDRGMAITNEHPFIACFRASFLAIVSIGPSFACLVHVLSARCKFTPSQLDQTLFRSHSTRLRFVCSNCARMDFRNATHSCGFGRMIAHLSWHALLVTRLELRGQVKAFPIDATIESNTALVFAVQLA